jgi:hypothetical protein
MTRASYAKALDRALQPLGFSREGDDWVRIRGDMWECVNRQSSWLGGVTVNLYMKDLETEKLYLEIFGATGAVQMPAIDTRIGALMDGYDHWWKSNEADGPSTLAKAVVEKGLPWFDRVRTLEEQAEHWFGRKTALSSRGYHGRSLVGLALTLYRMGDTAEAREILRKPVPKTAIPANVEQVAKVREWLGCEAARPQTPQG